MVRHVVEIDGCCTLIQEFDTFDTHLSELAFRLSLRLQEISILLGDTIDTASLRLGWLVNLRCNNLIETERVLVNRLNHVLKLLHFVFDR